MTRRLAVLSMHTSPLAQPGRGDSGGMNVYVRELCGVLARRGLEVDVFVRRDTEPLPELVDVEPGFRVHHLPVGAPELTKEELPSVVDAFADAVRDRLTDEPPDALHAHYWLSAAAGHRLKHELEVPLAVTFHTLGRVKRLAGDLESDARIEAEQTAIGCADLLVVNGPPDRDAVLSLYEADPDRVVVAPPGVDPTVFAPGSADGARRALDLDDGPRLLFVGRIQPLKGLDLAIAALAELRNPRARLTVIGGPSGASGRRYVDEVRRLATGLGVADRIDWVPPVPHVLLSTWMRAADVVVVPSRSESFGLVALEAAACGTPVVACAVGGLRSLVRHGASGYLVEGREPAEFAAAIDLILGDSRLAARLSAGALEVAGAHTWSAMADHVLPALDGLRERELATCV